MYNGNNGRYYGDSSMGYGYSPNRSCDVSHDNPHSQFLGASGSKQGGFYYSGTPICSGRPATKGRYLGNGQFVED